VIVRPLPLTIWSGGLLLVVLLVAATQPADVDGGPRRLLTPMARVDDPAPVAGAGPAPTMLLAAGTPLARLPLPEPALATPSVLPTPIVPAPVASAPSPAVASGPPPPLVLAAVAPPPPVFRRWTFADGWTGLGFDEALVMTNPTHQPARLRVIYDRPGLPPLTRAFVVAARGQRTVTVTDEVDGVGRNGGQGWSVTTRVESLDTADLEIERVLRLHYRARRAAPPG
jgi:hypothetical protein